MCAAIGTVKTQYHDATCLHLQREGLCIQEVALQQDKLPSPKISQDRESILRMRWDDACSAGDLWVKEEDEEGRMPLTTDIELASSSKYFIKGGRQREVIHFAKDHVFLYFGWLVNLQTLEIALPASSSVPAGCIRQCVSRVVNKHSESHVQPH